MTSSGVTKIVQLERQSQAFVKVIRLMNTYNTFYIIVLCKEIGYFLNIVFESEKCVI